MATKRQIDAIQVRIDRGVKWLDNKIGRKVWSKKIDLGQLDLGNPRTCMIGEVLGSYGRMDDVDEKAFQKSENYGFDSKKETYSLLTQLWKCTLIRMGIGIKDIN